jgi:hypothetical protein
MSIRALTFFQNGGKKVVTLVLGSWLKLREHKKKQFGRKVETWDVFKHNPKCVSTKSNLTRLLNAFSLWEFDFHCGAWFEISNLILIQMIFESFGKVECELQHGELTFSKQILGSRSYGQLKYCNGNEKFNACSSRVSWMRAQMMFD